MLVAGLYAVSQDQPYLVAAHVSERIIVRVGPVPDTSLCVLLLLFTSAAQYYYWDLWGGFAAAVMVSHSLPHLFLPSPTFVLAVGSMFYLPFYSCESWDAKKSLQLQGAAKWIQRLELEWSHSLG